VRPYTRTFTVLAQDPGARLAGNLVFVPVDVPYEDLGPGPTGYRVRVIDFDASADRLYTSWDDQRQPADTYALPEQSLNATQRRSWEQKLLSDPRFHAQNVYAIVMRTLARFEFALGRRVAWGFEGHQLHVAPHAFLHANAYYSREDKALMFGYFQSARTEETVFTCLAHDIVAHETTHAILDGIREGFTEPSTADQAAFHEGFADVVALLSVFSLPSVVELVLADGATPVQTAAGVRMIAAAAVSEKAILHSMLLGLGKQFGASLDADGGRADCLRRSISIAPNADLLSSPEYQAPHTRGEVFAAAMLRSFVAMWTARIAALGRFQHNQYNLDMVLAAGTSAADSLLTMAIRALDYCPPVDLDFGAYLSALLTADTEALPDDGRYKYRALVRSTFASYGMMPSPLRTDPHTGCWQGFASNAEVVYNRTNSESLLRDKEEVFRFLWENRRLLGIDERAYFRVSSVRIISRVGPDGFFLRETVCEYVQVAQLFGSEAMSKLGVARPAGMPTRQPITAYGGGTLIFDQYGRLKYHVEHRLDDAERQSKRLEYLWRNGLLDAMSGRKLQFGELHELRCGSRQ